MSASIARQGMVAGRVVEAFRTAATPGSRAMPSAGAAPVPRWFPWAEFADLVERVAAGADGAALLERIGGQLFARDPVLDAVGAVLTEPHKLLAWAVENVLALAYPAQEFRYEVATASTAVVTVETAAPSTPSAAWFGLCAGTLANLTLHLGLPACAVGTQVAGASCVYTLELPPAHSVRSPPPRASPDDELRAVLVGFEELREHLLEKVRLAAGSPRPSFETKVAAAAATWRLSPRESEALTCLVRGLSNKETAAELGCAVTTAELHVTRVLRKSGSSSRVQLTARFWSEGG